MCLDAYILRPLKLVFVTLAIASAIDALQPTAWRNGTVLAPKPNVSLRNATLKTCLHRLTDKPFAQLVSKTQLSGTYWEISQVASTALACGVSPRMAGTVVACPDTIGLNASQAKDQRGENGEFHFGRSFNGQDSSSCCLVIERVDVVVWANIERVPCLLYIGLRNSESAELHETPIR